MALVIKKPVDLSSLGDEYKGINLVFKSIPSKDLVGIDEKQEAFEKDKQGNPKTGQAIPFFIEILTNYFLEGTQDETKLSKDDVSELDSDALLYCFEILMGQSADPKDSGSLTNPSSTEPESPPK